MKIIIVTQEEPFYIPLFLSQLKPELIKQLKLIIVLPLHSNLKKFIQQYFEMYGAYMLGWQSLRFILFKFFDFIGIFFPLKRYYSVKIYAHKNQIKIAKFDKISDPNLISLVGEIRPDLIISIASPQIFPKKLLELPKKGCINIHQSLLPKYRGINPSFWVLLNKERETGVTVHYMNENIDDGEIIMQEKVKITANETLHSLYLKNIVRGAKILQETIDLIEKGKVKTFPNNKSQATYFSFPKQEEGKRFRQLGKRFI